MAIIDLKSKFREKNNFKKPYVYHEIPSNDENGNTYNGILGLLNSKKDDVVRISKYLADVKNSANFISKQVSLHKLNPLTELGEGLRTWTPLNLMSQIVANTTGGSVKGFGLNPLNDLSYVQFKKNEILSDDYNENRLIKLSKKLFIDGDSIIDTYNGGSGSIMGIGRTYIMRSEYTGKKMDDLMTNVFKSNVLRTPFEIESDILSSTKMVDSLEQYYGTKFKVNESYPSYLNNNSLDLSERETHEQGTDFRAKLLNLINEETGKPFVETFKKFNIAKRVGLGYSDETIGKLPIYYADSPTGKSNKSKILDKRISEEVVRPNSDYLNDQIRDLVRFRVELIDVDNPNFGDYIILRSTITGLNNNFTSTWNSVNYAGRGETFKRYSSTNSTISFNFTIYASSRGEMKIMYQKLNALISGAMYPSYNKQHKMRGSMIRLTIGDFMENQPCIVDSFNLVVPDDNSWEIAYDGQQNQINGITDDYVLPKIITGSMSISPIYNFLPQKSLSKTFFVLPNENIKEARSLDWIGGDKGEMKQYESSKASNKELKSFNFTSQFKKEEESDDVKSNLSELSMMNSKAYKDFKK
jgi:hypothetical protein